MQEINFKEICYSWLETKKKTLKIATISLYERNLELYIIPFLGDLTLEEANSYEQEFIQKMHDVPESHIKNVINQYRSIIKYGNKDKKHEFPITIKKNVCVLTEHEIELVKREIKKKESVEIAILLYTGINLGELVALTQDDFDLVNNMICINKTAQRLSTKNESTQTKVYLSNNDNNERKIPISEELLQLMKTRKIKYGLDPRTIQKHLKKIEKKTNVRLTSTIIRDTFAVNLIRKGANPIVIAKLMGVKISHFYTRYSEYLEGIITDNDLREAIKLI